MNREEMERLACAVLDGSARDDDVKRLAKEIILEMPLGPDVIDVPTGAGDSDIACAGCDEIVSMPHTWQQCIAELKRWKDRLADALGKEESRVEGAHERIADLESRLSATHGERE